MDFILHAIIKFRKTILLTFGIIAAISVLFLSGTSVNYSMVDYLPKEANSTQAINVLEKEFEGGLPNLTVMIKNVTIQEALNYKKQLSDIDGVLTVSWLDDVLGKSTIVSTPLDYLDRDVTEKYYKNQTALYSLEIESGKEASATQGIYSLIGDSNSMIGEALTNASAQSKSTSEVINAMIILIPIIIVILIIATVSWIEPILFMLTIGIAILINMGSNIIFGEVSFITKTVSPVLQLAVSLDYAIFLLHSFTDKRLNYEPKEAMFLAMKESLPTVSASAMTTIIGFSALIFMRFEIGADLGINLLKGIILSFISVMVFLPVVTLIFYKWIDKTMHNNWMPHHGGISKFLLQIRIPLLIIAIILMIPTYLGQSHASFLYGMGVEDEQSRSVVDEKEIEQVFGNNNTLLLMVPRDSVAKEDALCEALKSIDYINTVVSYSEIVGTKIPTAFVPEVALQNFYSDHYARIILYTSLPVENDVTFTTIDQIKEITQQHYSEYYLTGQSASLNDMKNVVGVDMNRINLIAIIGIFIVLLISFRSLTIPILLIFTIETAIWINLSVPYFSNTSISFIGYLILSTVQLGATVDYAILVTHRYLDARQNEHKKEAMYTALKNNIGAVLISAAILATAGFTLAGTTQNPIIKELGTLLGRGTVLSFIMVVGVLPALLILFDTVIQKTTLSHNFHQSPKQGGR